jgi:tetratricopeptide (TPR) repeat protein
VLSALAPSDTVVAIWRQFADEAERARAWPTVRDALGAIDQARPDAATALRGAQAALNADDPAVALRLARRAAPALDETHRTAEVLPIELESLARLGQANEAEALLAGAARSLGDDGVRGYARTIAWAWIRAGDITRARKALEGATLAAEDAVAGWLALFDGDLDGARAALRNTEVPGQDAVSALALLNRTHQPRSAPIGAAFLALARGDSAQAARRFENAAADLPDAAPLLVALAARIETARHSDDRALALWQRVAAQYAEAPEAPEAQLEWARGLKRRGDLTGARDHLEQLILTYPGSALVPQARRELDALRMGAAQ